MGKSKGIAIGRLVGFTTSILSARGQLAAGLPWPVIECLSENSRNRGGPPVKRLTYSAIFLLVVLPVLSMPTFAQGAQGFVGNWKSDPGTPTMTRKLVLEGKVI